MLLLIKKVICEIRFPPKVRYFQERIPFADELTGDFPDWRFSPTSLTFLNTKKRRKVIFTSRRIAIVFENERVYGTFSKMAMPILSDYCKRLNIKSFSRIGVRVYYIKETEEMSFNKLKDLLMKKSFRDEIPSIIDTNAIPT